MNSTQHFPVIIVGTGPTGLALANLLGGYGVSTLVLERNASTVDEPRAVSIDDESLRTLQMVGLIDQALPQIVQGYGVHYFSWSGKEFARVEPTSTEYGYPKRNAFRQAVLVKQLNEGLRRFGQVEVRFDHDLKRFTQDDKQVTLEVDCKGEPLVFSCDWLVACDGGRSGVREQLGITLSGNTFAEKWLIVDMLNRKEPFRHTRTYCDPARPAIRLPGPEGTVRYEFMLKEGETAEYVLDDARLRQWIREREPSDAELELARKVVYTFHARIAERWQDGRVFLAGDAAHLTPPFAGQGMNSGVRDAANLAWKLAAVTRGESGVQLLDTYEVERKPHAWALIKMAILIGRYMQPKSKLGAMAAQWALALCSLYRPARDYVLQLKFKPKPRFNQGFFLPDQTPGAQVRAGQLLPQPRMEWPGGTRQLLDVALGSGFAFLSWAGAPVCEAVERSCRLLGVRHIQLIAREDDFLQCADLDTDNNDVIRDCDGILEAMLAQAGADAVLVRPDRYVFAFLKGDGAAQGAELERLCAGYRGAAR